MNKKNDYDIIIIGGGAAGFVSSKLANGMGKKVAMIEKNKLGGECTWTGCIPTKTLLKASYVAYQTNNLSDFGLSMAKKYHVHTENVMNHVRSVVQEVYNGHSIESFKELGIDVFFGEPHFINNTTIELNSEKLTAKHFIIATGSSPYVPPIDGLEDVPYFTNETFFNLQTLPKSMVVLGGGPIGIEIASALLHLGTEVTVVEMVDRILAHDDKELTNMLTNRLQEFGMNILTKTRAVKFSIEDDMIAVTTKGEDGEESIIKAESILVAVGRKPNVENLNLENACVLYNKRGIVVDDYLRTSSLNIYACGDVVGPYQFSHMAEYQAIYATSNALLPINRRVDYRNVIWCTFTNPQIGHLGLTEEEAREKYGDDIKIYRYNYKNIDRAKTDRTEFGMSKIICRKNGTIVGAHILGYGAGDILQEVQVVKTLNIPLNKLHSVIHTYPTYSEIIKKPADMCYIDSLKKNLFIKMLQAFVHKKEE